MILTTHFKHLNALNWFNVSIQYFFFFQKETQAQRTASIGIELRLIWKEYTSYPKWVLLQRPKLHTLMCDVQTCIIIFYSLWWYKDLILKVGWWCNALSLPALKCTGNVHSYKKYLKFINIVLLLLRISNSYWYFLCCY